MAELSLSDLLKNSGFNDRSTRRSAFETSRTAARITQLFSMVVPATAKNYTLNIIFNKENNNGLNIFIIH